ncbi:hypothetical protein Hanom_Chr01g00080221 [Helianthus anomalus]
MAWCFIWRHCSWRGVLFGDCSWCGVLNIWRHCSWRGVLSGDIVHGVVFYLETLFMVWCFIWRLFMVWCFKHLEP